MTKQSKPLRNLKGIEAGLGEIAIIADCFAICLCTFWALKKLIEMDFAGLWLPVLSILWIYGNLLAALGSWSDE